MTPSVSVAMLAYGEEEYLGEAVRAVLDSTGVNVQLIVVDNGCTSDAVATLPDGEPEVRRAEVVKPLDSPFDAPAIQAATPPPIDF